MKEAILAKILAITPDDFNKVVLALVALIALLLTPWMQWRVARRQAADNISAKRQIWIDGLREDMSKFLALSARVNDLRRPGLMISEAAAQENFNDLAATNLEASELAIRIKLRLNPNEKQHNELVRLLGLLTAASADPPERETDEQRKAAKRAFHAARDNVVSHVQTVLKFEWERIKRGDV